jgi:hypothetical protein
MMMKQHITPEQIISLIPEAQEVLSGWFKDTIKWDDNHVRVYIPEERTAADNGVFEGNWDREYEFFYPELYIGKLKNHEGTILPLLDVSQLIELLDICIQAEELSGPWQMFRSSDSAQWRVMTATATCHSSELCDALWEATRKLLEGSSHAPIDGQQQ